MTTLDEVHTLRVTAVRLLPGLWQARVQMNVAIGVLEYFARDAERELNTGQFTPRRLDSQIARDVRVLQSMLSAFLRIYPPRG
jgi:hypothetical protein